VIFFVKILKKKKPMTKIEQLLDISYQTNEVIKELNPSLMTREGSTLLKIIQSIQAQQIIIIEYLNEIPKTKD
jgi:hypothetical protein